MMPNTILAQGPWKKGRHVDRDTFAHVWLAAPFQDLSHRLRAQNACGDGSKVENVEKVNFAWEGIGDGGSTTGQADRTGDGCYEAC